MINAIVLVIFVSCRILERTVTSMRKTLEGSVGGEWV